MRLCVVGSGYVGLVTGACLADTGNHVVSVDRDESLVAELSRGVSTIFEPGLEDLLKSNLKSGRLRFTTDLRSAVQMAQIVFIAVGTPPREDGSADLSGVDAVARGVGEAMSGYTIVVMKSTVPVGTCDRIEKLIGEVAQHPFCVVSNPEFLKEGTAVDDFQRPDRVIIGADNDEAGEIIASLYHPFVRNNKPIIIMSRRASEMSKYASNAYLATRISFINEMAEICDALHVDVDEVRRGIGADARIGHHFMYPGVGYGGSCFPKDVQALTNFAHQAGVHAEILEAVHTRNLNQRKRIVARVLERLGSDLSGKRIAVWGVAFKPQTDDIREAPAITIIEQLLEAGATVAAHDPRALEKTRAHFANRIEYCEDGYEALQGAEALVAVTEWMEYRSPDFDQMKALLKQPLIFDARNIWNARTVRRYGFEYYSVGRPALLPDVEQADQC